MITPQELSRRRLVVAAYNQRVAANYALFADLYRTRYLSKHRDWRRWFWPPYEQSWVLEQIAGWQLLAEAHAFTARVLMGIEEEAGP